VFGLTLKALRSLSLKGAISVKTLLLQRVLPAVLTVFVVSVQAQTNVPATSVPGITVASGLNAGKRALAAGQYAQAKALFTATLSEHPDNVAAKLGLADSELGLDHDATAEEMYRQIVALQPELWQAHKNLIMVEAALGRWEDFDSERTVLRLARERGAPGISSRESDVIDSFLVKGKRWVVREYFEPAGRSATRYNFESFSADGKAAEYISLDGAEAAIAAKTDSVVIGGTAQSPVAPHRYTLNWFTGKAHGTIRSYGLQEPKYETVRSNVLQWLRR
jgi:hypothetical protein